MNTRFVRTVASLGIMGVVAVPAAGQRVRAGVDVRVGDRGVVAATVDTRAGGRLDVRYDSRGRYDRSWRHGPRRRAWIRHQREVDRLIREHDRLHRRMRHLHPRVALRMHQRWHERAFRQHGHVHAEWEHGYEARPRGGRHGRGRAGPRAW